MTSLGKYELHEQLGRGAFGTVYRATDTDLDRVVALKILHPQLTTDPDFLERFRNEARLVASLDSLNIVTVYGLGEIDGRAFISMKYLPGGSLGDMISKSGPLDFTRAQQVLQEVCSGLSAAHKKGLIHRDIKPSNILFDSDDHAVIGDFGLARAVQLSSSTATSSTGAVGTPAYRAPELWLGKPPASPVSDIYSLGCMLSEMLSGMVLFSGETTEEVLTKHLITGPEIPETFPPGVPSAVPLVIQKMVAKEMKDRFQDVSEITKAFASEISITPPLPGKQAMNWKRLGMTLGIVFVFLAIIGLAIKFLTGNAGGSGEQTPAPLTSNPATLGNEPIIEPGTSIPTEAPLIENVPPPEQQVAGSGTETASPREAMGMVFIPKTSFTMGKPADQAYKECLSVRPDCKIKNYQDESPPHTVTLDAYWIDQTEVTNEMFTLFLNTEGNQSEGGVSWLNISSETLYIRNTGSTWRVSQGYEDYPATGVTWFGALAYCKWAGKSLPTEAQWELAARGTDDRTFPWGNSDPDCSLANIFECGGKVAAVGSFIAGSSPYKVYDLAGNVWEWVADWYQKNYYEMSMNSINPPGPEKANNRVLRGGSWRDLGDGIRTTFRYRKEPEYSSNSVGFRCVRTDEKTP